MAASVLTFYCEATREYEVLNASTSVEKLLAQAYARVKKAENWAKRHPAWLTGTYFRSMERKTCNKITIITFYVVKEELKARLTWKEAMELADEIYTIQTFKG